MDHLPWHRLDRPRPQVPYLCDNLTDDDICRTWEEFRSWLDTYTWDLHPDISLTTIARHCQSWLFFGLIRIFTEARKEIFSLQNYISPDDLSRLCTKGLNLRHWIADAQGYDVVPILARSQTRLSQWLTTLEETMEHHEPSNCELFNVFWSTALLLESVTSIFGYSMPSIARQVNSSSFVRSTLRAIGRCPALLEKQISSLIETWTILSIPLAPESFENAQVILHEACAFDQCELFHKSNYVHEKQHTPDCRSDSHCAVRGIDSTILTCLIERKSIPLVRSELNSATINIEVVDESFEPEFDVISHVWAGGLGNPDANEMYECQLEHLHAVLSATNHLRSTSNYWIDTLCIPAQNDPLKCLAIGEMARIYASARRVLVLDPIMQHTNANDLTEDEIAIVIATSPWMARSWTLQEAALAIQLEFRFKDKTINLDSVNSGPLQNRLLQVLWTRDVDRLSGDRPKATNSGQRLQSVWQELLHRTSTQVTDIAAIIAVFVDRSADEVLNITPKQRVAALLTSQTLLPTSLLFTAAERSVDTWQPKLPTCADFDAKLRSSTFLRVTNLNLLEISDLRDLYMMSCPQSLHLRGEMVLHEVMDNRYFKIRFPTIGDSHLQTHNGEGNKSQAGRDRVLFMLPRSAVNAKTDHECAQDHQGLCFIMMPGARTAEQAVFHQSFRWSAMKSEMTAITHNHQSMIQPPELEVTLFPYFGVNESRHEYQLALDMGFQAVPRLSWSRKQFYPFIQHSTLAANPLKFLERIRDFAHVLIGSRLFNSTLVFLVMLLSPDFSIPMSSRLLHFAVSSIALILIWLAYTQLNNIESRYISKSFKMHIQKVWAISFSTLDERAEQQKFATDRQLRRLVVFSSLYCVVWLVALLVALPYYLSIARTDRGLETRLVVDILRVGTPIYMLGQVAEFGLAYVCLDTTWTIYCYLCVEALLRTILLVLTLSRAFLDQRSTTDEHHDDIDNDQADLNTYRSSDPRYDAAELANQIVIMFVLSGLGVVLGLFTYVLWITVEARETGFVVLGTKCALSLAVGGMGVMLAAKIAGAFLTCFKILWQWAVPAGLPDTLSLVAYRANQHVAIDYRAI